MIRNLAPMSTGKESYADLEVLVAKLLKDLHVNREGIRVNTVKRLQRLTMTNQVNTQLSEWNWEA